MTDTSHSDCYYENKERQHIIKEISFEEFKADENSFTYGNPFLRPSIFELSLKHLYYMRKLVILALYDNNGNTIRSVLLCYQGKMRRYGFPVNYFYGFPNLLGLFVDVLSTVENKADVFLEFMQYIIDKKKWDKVEFLNIPYIQALTLREWLQKREMIVSLNRSYARVAQKANSLDEYMKYQAEYKEMRYYRSLCRRYLERTDPITFKVFYDESMLISMFDIANNSWKAPLNTNIAHPRMKQYYRELVKYYSSIKVLRVFILFHQDRPIAYIFGAIFNKCCYFIKADFDESYKAWNAGNVLWYYTIKHMHENETGVASFNFLSNYPYLKKWTNQTKEYATVTIYRNNAKGRMYDFFSNKLIPFVKVCLYRLHPK